jgi:dinuclear metal center YbgI/SA1388 family protein
MSNSPVPLAHALTALDQIAPLRLAASWDNVGLLVEGEGGIARALCTIDLTTAVHEEALRSGADLVIAYHPLIFGGLKSLTRRDPKTATVLELARRGVHVYSPHTALDCVTGGVNDWLLEAFGSCREVAPIVPDALEPAMGVGRRATLDDPRPLDALLPDLKAHLGLAQVRIAGDSTQPIRSAAVCPGAGGSVFSELAKRGERVDLLLTGEMRHHDVLAAAAAGTAVVLTDHTNTERGYLPRYARQVADALGIEVAVSTTDADPLVIR